MAEHVLAAVRAGPSKTELREFPMPEALKRDTAIRAVGAEVGDGVIHVSLLPWQE